LNIKNGLVAFLRLIANMILIMILFCAGQRDNGLIENNTMI